jgi:hypothetical protein
MSTILQKIAGAFHHSFSWLQDNLSDEGVVKAIYADLGLDPNNAKKLADFPPETMDSIARYRDAVDPTPEAFLEALDDIIDLIEHLANLTDKNGKLDEAVLHTVIGLFVTNYARFHFPSLYWFAEPAFFLESLATSDPIVKGNSVAFTDGLKRIGSFLLDLGFRDSANAFNKIIDRFSSPLETLKETFPLATEADARRLSDFTLQPLAIALAIWESQRLKAQIESPSPFSKRDVAFIADSIYGWDSAPRSNTPMADKIAERALTFSVIGIEDSNSDVDAKAALNCTMMWMPSAHGTPGLLLGLGGSAQVELDLGDDWNLILKLSSASAIDFLISDDKPLVHGPSDASVGFVLEQSPDESGLPNVIPDRKGTRLEFERIAFSGDISTREAVVKLLVQNSALVIAANKDADGFINSVLPSGETRISFDLGIGLSSERGLYIEGGTGLKVIIPIAKKLGPLIIHQLLLSVVATTEAKPPHVTTEISAGFGLQLGPITATVERLGLEMRVEFPEKKKPDFSIGFKPPNGVGLAIDARGVEGGGFLLFDRDKGQYAGILQVNLNLERVSMTLTAIGLINTKMPDGTKGFSLVVILTAEFMWPLGLGFTLTGLGLILGIHRTFNEKALQDGAKNHTLDSILFPKDPIRNAPTLLATLGTVFPPAKGHHFIGGMIQMTWGDSPLSPIVTMSLGIAVEFGVRSRLLVVGQIKSILPTEKQDLIRFHLDAIGIVDFDQKTASIDATLYDSRLAKTFTISGDMAMRSSWGNSPSFTLAIGGFHPAFNPPPNFPKLKRVTINLTSGDNPRLRCESYFALTSNTVQFGARAELYASGAGFSIQGEIGFDVLIQRSPFRFEASFFAQVQLKRGNTNLFKVRVEGTLAGPRPLHIKGKATFEILWWDVSIRFDKTLIKGEPPPPAEIVDVSPLLREALAQQSNWRSQLPDGQRAMVTLRAQAGASTDVLLHPLGTLTIKQTVVPLNFDISKFGPNAPSGSRRFAITKITVGEQQQKLDTERDFFAPAQFTEMSDDQKLSRPSFEKMDAGVTFGSAVFEIPDKDEDRIHVNAIEFETWIIDKDTNEPRPADPVNNTTGKTLFYQLNAARFIKQARFGAAGSSDLRRTGAARYRTVIGKNQIAKEGWTIVNDELTPQPLAGVAAGKALSYSEAEQTLSKLKRQDPVKASSLKILRPSELKIESV